jgi:hypothetical protein
LAEALRNVIQENGVVRYEQAKLNAMQALAQWEGK